MARSAFAQTAIVGIGSTDYHRVNRVEGGYASGEEYAIQATLAALEDAGLGLSDIDGLVVGGLARYEQFMFQSGLREVRFLAHYPSAGRMCPGALAHAAMAVRHGMADCVLAFNTLTFGSRRIRFNGGESDGGSGMDALGDLYDLAYGMTTPGAFYALAFSRYAELYGGTEAELAAIPIALRDWARLNPAATMQDPLDLDGYLEARYIARPLRINDYCLVSDGAAAYVVTSAERARDLRQPPVYIGHVAERTNVREWYVAEDFWIDACQSMKADLFGATGLTLDDISALQVYDNFSPSVLWVLEGFGFAPRGEGLGWIRDTGIGPGGRFPINTSGGMISEAYLQGWNNHIESVRQLRGQAGARQIPDCRAILYAGLSALPASDILLSDPM